MLLFLYRLFIVGFPPKCKHEFGRWEVASVKSSSLGDIKVHQVRRCLNCGLHEFKIDYKG